VPLLPPQKNILPSCILTQAANPDLAFGILKGKVLNLFSFKLYSSISAVLYPSIYLPPNNKILDFDIGIAENFVLGLPIIATSFQTPLYTSKHSQLNSF
jgi:hypothetical protein